MEIYLQPEKPLYNTDMKFEEFETAINEAAAELPSKFKAVLQKEGIKILPRESAPEKIKAEFRGGIILGVFIGVSRKDRSAFLVQHEPTRIEIYQESFEKMCGEKLNDVFRAEITNTIIHEIAHYFGFDENEIAARGF
ncbi:metallopeptidase family protein [bacterium]|nr:metallopeptidase family protein [bacterium]